ncbi:glycosyltransferase family 4 protein, partial [Candidatus Bathyarchaeota archaeon]|nr:glycosyltransferase family 4 protein [Candidatus Bathyarchaeota archaeon]
KRRVPESSNEHIAFLGTYAPRECGIATFTKDLIDSISLLGEFAPARVITVNEIATTYDYNIKVKRQIRQDFEEDYVQAAKYVNSSRVNAVSVQHEFRIYGGEWGKYILSFLRNVDKPVITTLHTIQPDFEQKARNVLKEILDLSKAIVVMARAAKGILKEYNVPDKKIHVVQHGCPDIPFVASDSVKPSLGLKGRTILSTFGLISRGKGIEYAIQALPPLVEKHPDILYLIIGETHPEVRKFEGESYRMELIRLVGKLGLENHVRFHNRFLTKRELVRYLQATDIYITPYISANQISSGTLVYALGSGRAVVSTPYLHAKEVLSHGRGLFCKFRDPDSIAYEVKELIENDKLRRDMEKKAYRYSRSFIWPKVARKYADTFKQAIHDQGER